MRNIETSQVINAPVELVWKVLMNFNDYPNWNPFIKSISGNSTPGEQITAELCLPGKKPMIFKPTVLSAIPNQEFSWLGKLGVKGLFDGEHYFKLEKLSENKTRFIQGEKFTGILSGLLFKLMGAETREGFEEMNRSLAQVCLNAD